MSENLFSGLELQMMLIFFWSDALTRKKALLVVEVWIILILNWYGINGPIIVYHVFVIILDEVIV